MGLTRRSTLSKKLLPEQEEAAVFAASKNGCALFCEQRTGKTLITLRVVELTDAQEALFVVPLTNKHTTWVKLVGVFLTHKVFTEWEKFKKATGKKILIVHYEELGDKKRNGKVVSKGIITKLARYKNWDLVVFDESQRLKARGSLASRCARRLRHARRRIVLSGTPIDKTPIDVWAQLRFADHMIFGDKWSDFDEEYLKPTGFMGHQRKFKGGAEERFLKKLSQVAMRVERVDLGIKEAHLTKIPVRMLGEQRRLYEKLEETSVLKNLKIKTPLKVTQMVKLQQLTSGFIFDEDKNITWTGSAKLRKFKWLLNKLRDRTPIVIFCRYLPEIEAIAEYCRTKFKRVEVLHGKVKDKKNDPRRTELLERFQSGKIDILIAQVKTGGVGVDLYRSSCAIIMSRTFSYIDDDQMRARLLGLGKTDRIDFFLIYVKGTIDEDIDIAVEAKCSVTKTVLNRLRRKKKWH